MSMFSWLFRKPAPSKSSAKGESTVGMGNDATVPLSPGQPLPPAANPAMNRKNERIERRELLYLVVRDAMVRSSVLSASYKFKVLSLDQQGKQFLIMVDLAHEYGGDTARLSEIEALIAQTAKGRFDIVVTAVYWRVNEHVAVGKPHMGASHTPASHAPASHAPAVAHPPAAHRHAAPTAAHTAPHPASHPAPAPAPMAAGAVRAAPTRRAPIAPPPMAAPEPASPIIGTPARAPLVPPVTHDTMPASLVPQPSAPAPLLASRSGSGSGGARYEPIEADELAAFKRALGQTAGAAPAASGQVPLGVTVHSGPRMVSVSSPTGFEDTQMPEDKGQGHDLGRTQYGDLM